MIKVDMKSLRVLVIDDEFFMRKTIIRVLNDLGVENVFDASNGAEGLLQMGKIGKDLDLVICDLEMPQMGGFEFLNQLRKLPENLNPKIPVLIVSGHSEDESVRKVVELGINGFLVKPISKQELANRINAAIISPVTEPTKLKN